MKLNKLLVVSLFTILSLGFTAQAFAVCGQYGKVYKIYSRVSGTSNYSYWYIAPRSTNLPTYGYYAYSTSSDSEANNTLRAASIDGTTVYLQGSATSCPSSGTYRYMGPINYTYKYNNY